MARLCWTTRPISAAQSHYCAQSAWLHGHLLQALGGEVGWDAAALKATECKAFREYLQ